MNWDGAKKFLVRATSDDGFGRRDVDLRLVAQDVKDGIP